MGADGYLVKIENYKNYRFNNEGKLQYTFVSCNPEIDYPAIDDEFDYKNELRTDKKPVQHRRIIPAKVKQEVWKRDHGRCIDCGAIEELHFDHIIPYSKGGTSIMAENIQLLCARCNLEKRDRII